MEQVQSNLSEIYDETPVNYQVSADNGYSTDMNAEYLEQNGFDGYIYHHENSQENKKNTIYPINHLQKIIFSMITK